MGVSSAAALAAIAVWAATASAGPSPLALKRIVAVRQASKFTLKVELDKSWTNTVFRPGSGTELRVLYDTNADSRADFTGKVVYGGGTLSELISGQGRRYEPVPVTRPSQFVAKFTHPVDVMFPNPSKPGTLRITVVLHTAGKDDRLPRKGWFEVPPPPQGQSSSAE
jgi:hypothetical protein